MFCACSANQAPIIKENRLLYFGYLFIGMPVETSFSISAASQAHHVLCQQLVQRYRGIMRYEGMREGERGSTEKPHTVLSIPSRITVRGSSNRLEQNGMPMWEEVANERRWRNHVTADITTRHWRY